MLLHVVHEVVQELNLLLNTRGVFLTGVIVLIAVKVDVVNVAKRKKIV
jgi:hypothetical protein